MLEVCFVATQRLNQKMQIIYYYHRVLVLVQSWSPWSTHTTTWACV